MKILPRRFKVIPTVLTLVLCSVGCNRNAHPAQNAQNPATPAQSTQAQSQTPGADGQLQPAPPPPTPPDAGTGSSATPPQPSAAPAPVPAGNQAENPAENPAAAPNSASAQSQAGVPVPVPGITVPRGARLTVRMNQTIDVKHAVSGERFSGIIAAPVVVGDSVAVPEGSTAHGEVLVAHKRGRFKGRSVLELTLTGIDVHGTEYRIETSDLTRTKKGKGKRSAALIGGGAGLGMLVGGVATGGVGLLVGGLAGGGAGTLASAFTGNRDVSIPAESTISFRLESALRLTPSTSEPEAR
jgi:hypothetical protein